MRSSQSYRCGIIGNNAAGKGKKKWREAPFPSYDDDEPYFFLKLVLSSRPMACLIPPGSQMLCTSLAAQHKKMVAASSLRPPVDKQRVDVRCTRHHWYPKYVMFQSKDSPPALVRRTTLSQAVCDFSIVTGAAVPIPRRQESICDAMNKIQHLHPDYYHSFHRRLYKSTYDNTGWINFLWRCSCQTGCHF